MSVVEEREQELMGNLTLLDDWFSQHEYLVSFARDLDVLPEADKQDCCKVAGCVSNAWVRTGLRDGGVHIRADSDSVVIRGIIGAISAMVEGATPQQVLAWEPRFLAHPALKEHVSADRKNGIGEILRLVKQGCAHR